MDQKSRKLMIMHMALRSRDDRQPMYQEKEEDLRIA